MKQLIRRYSMFFIIAIVCIFCSSCFNNKENDTVLDQNPKVEQVQESESLQEDASEKNIHTNLESTSDVITDIAETTDLPDNNYINKNDLSKDFLQNFYDFTEQTFAQIIRDNEVGNQIYAPLNFYQSLSMLYEISEGEARKEIQKVLNISDTIDNSSELNTAISSLQDRKSPIGEIIGKLNINSSLWLHDHINYKNELLNILQNQYNTEIFKGNLNDSEFQDLIVKWVYENANFEYKPRKSNQLAFIIFSTLDFYNEWMKKFNEEDTRTDTFFINDKEKVTCEFMNMENSSHPFIDGDNYISTIYNLKSRESMLFILPKEGFSVDDLIEEKGKLSGIIYDWNNDKAIPGKVKLSAPKFAYENEIDLKVTTQNLGINKIFDISSKAFSSFADGDIFIGDIRQASKIEIDEKGCSASSYTEIVAFGSAGTKGEAEIILNRPFIYILYRNKVPFLIGVVRNPLG